MLKKNILVGLSGGIAAYKTATLVRLFIKEACNVKVVMTPMAKKFITPLTLATLSKNPIYTEFFDPENGQWNSHVDLGLWADAYVIAPATANTIAKMALGIADNLLLTTYLSARCPVFFAPTMDVDMYNHPTTQQNIQILKNRGNICIEPNYGELASGLEGKGRMAEPEMILTVVKDFFTEQKDFLNRKVLITAGPTYEFIDPVRFIGNMSTGKMGIAIAQEFAKRGAEVFLILGPTNIDVTTQNIKVEKVVSAQQMFEAAMSLFPQCDIAVLAAAVADYTPVEFSSTKIKKDSDELIIKLKKNPDIALNLGKIKKDNQILVGFALETDEEIKNATEKLYKKNFDFIVLNSLKDTGAGFGYDTNKVTILDKFGNIDNYELKSKKQVAVDIVNKVKYFLK